MFVDIEIDSKEYELTTLHIAAIEGGGVCGYQLPSYSKKDFQEQFQKLLENKIKFSDFQNALVSYREKTDKKMQKFWEEIRTVLNKPEVSELIQKGWFLVVGRAFLYSRDINPLLNLAKLAPNAELNVENEEHREVKTEVKRLLLLWINDGIKHDNFKTAWDKLPDQVKKAKELWEGIKSELVQDKYAYLGKKFQHFIWFQNKESQYSSSLELDLSVLRFIAKSNLVDLDLSEQQQEEETEEAYKLSQVKFHLQFLAAYEVELENFLNALKKHQELNDILVKLKQPQYRHLVETSILIDGLEINVGKINSEPSLREKTLQELYKEGITAQKLKDALDVKNNEKLDAFWSEIKSELKTKYAYLSKTPILINGDNYNLEPLFAAAKDDTQYAKEGSELPAPAKNKLQSLFSAGVQHQIFKTSLVTINNQKLDDLWTQLKKVFNQPEFSKWKNTSIKIKNKNYDLKLLFTAKDKTTVKGSVLPLNAKLKLQQLLNDQVTSKMVENQLLALNQAEAEKNKQAKEKQQS